MADSYSDRDPVEELVEKYQERLRRGENPALSEYMAAYPEHAEAIRGLFPALVKIERLRPGADEAEERNHLIDPDSGRRIEQVGDFGIIREVGRGGMGAVYEAEQVSLGRQVALKVLIRRASRDRKTFERSRREARAAARLHHTKIVSVVEVGQNQGLVYYAMQFIEGHDFTRSAGRQFDNEGERRSLERGEWDELRRLAGARETSDVPIDDDACTTPRRGSCKPRACVARHCGISTG
jgi:hypothetical protein